MKKNVCTALGRLSLLLVALLLVASTSFAAKIATVEIPVQPELYAATPAALAPSQCAQCHTGVFASLKDNGGKHRFDIAQCLTCLRERLLDHRARLGIAAADRGQE